MRYSLSFAVDLKWYLPPKRPEMGKISNIFSDYGYVVKVNNSKLRGILNYIVDDHPIKFGSYG